MVKNSIASVFFMVFAGGICADAIRPQAQLKSIDVFGEALYWYTSETVDWAFTLTPGQNSLKTAYKTFVFDWAPGFRVGLGYNMEHDQWDTRASYTQFHSKAKGHAKGSVTTAFLAARLSLLEPFSTGKASLNVHYNMLDWDLGRTILVSKALSLRPSIGLKGGWITQKLHSSWATPNFLGFLLITASENLKQNFKGIGPKGGMTGKWSFGDIRKRAFSLIGQFEAGYLWGHWSIHDKYVDDLNTVIRVITTKRNFGSFVLHSFLGFGWDCNFKNDRAHFGFKFGYEIEDWLNQCQIFTDTSGSQNNDLILQGLTLGLNFDF